MSTNCTTTAPDPFDPASLRLGQDFGAAACVKKVLTTIPVRKPNRHEFVRVRPGDEWRLQTAVFEDKVSREIYLVDKGLWGELAGEVNGVALLLAINRQGDLFFWPAKLPTDGRTNAWNESALAAASIGEERWIRLAANMQAGMYDTFEAAGALSDPIWPEQDLTGLLRLAFKDRFITSKEHPVLKQLRGEA